MARFTTICMVLMATCRRPAITKSSLISKFYHHTAAGGMQNRSLVLNQYCTISNNQNPNRRSGNYGPTMWDFEFIQSINNDYAGEKYMKRFNELMKEMKELMNNVEGLEELEKLELIDNLHRLGVSYHFKKEIVPILRSIHQQPTYKSDSLYTTALKFKLLRQHGFHISQDILNDFKDEHGNLKQSLYKDTKGLLQLYEASFLSTEAESTLESANKFTMSLLKNYLNNQYGEEDNLTVELVRHALELPLHWMMLRVETSWFINIYEIMPNVNPLVLELAKLDFNIIQATHQEELRNISRWWKSTCLAEELPFARDRLVEAYFWTVGTIFEPQHGYCRRMLTKINTLAVAIDDIYDVYGSLPELQLFTDAVERWDVKAMEQLPDYMKVCYLSLFNNINEMAYKVHKEQGINVLPYLKKTWADYCEYSLREARWHFNGCRPTLQEYMDNAWISIGAPMYLVHAFCFVTNPIREEALASLSKYPDIIRWCSIIVRLADDLGTSSDEMKRGDVPKSIQCYMNEMEISEEEAREHVKFCIKETWKLINKAQKENSLFSETFIGVAINVARTTHCVYQHGDGHGIQNVEIKDTISKLFFEPIKISIP